jgi:hypothetical protein
MAAAAQRRFPGSRLHYVDRGAWLDLEERRGSRVRRGIGWLWRCHGGLDVHFEPTRARANASGFPDTARGALALLGREPSALERFAYDRSVLHVLAGEGDTAKLLLRAVLVGEAQPEIGAEGLRRALILYDAVSHLPRAQAIVRAWVDDARALLGLGPASQAPNGSPSRAREDGVSLAP